MKKAHIGSFKIGDVNKSNVVVGNHNTAVAMAGSHADRLVHEPRIFDQARTKTPRHYTYNLSLEKVKGLLVTSIKASLGKKRGSLKERVLEKVSQEDNIGSPGLMLRKVEAFNWSGLNSNDVNVQFSIRTVVDAHQIVDLNIIVYIGGKANCGKHRVKLPKDAKLDEREWTISYGFLKITFPKDSTFSKSEGKGKGKDEGKGKGKGSGQGGGYH